MALGIPVAVWHITDSLVALGCPAPFLLFNAILHLFTPRPHRVAVAISLPPGALPIARRLFGYMTILCLIVPVVASQWSASFSQLCAFVAALSLPDITRRSPGHLCPPHWQSIPSKLVGNLVARKS